MFVTRYSSPDKVLPEQIPGHLIHGPKIIFHILNSSDKLSIVLNDELDKLTSHDNNVLNNSNICIVYDFYGSVVKDTVNTRCSTDNKITVCNSEYSYSAEWPAVVVVHGLNRYSEEEGYLAAQYLMISRARVYCSVVIVPGYKNGYSEKNRRFLLNLVEKLKDKVGFVRH
jgi:hypothetical protein